LDALTGATEVNQPTLFASPVIPSRAPCADRPRLSRQNAVILARLQQGPVSNDELSRIARKYTGRLSELRQAGYTICCFAKDHKTGLSWYRLEAA
jgi:hypothetical protein